jgi:cellulose synthase/poly-beta-1,6-N-acetylglucosamine synthase-like glycosyltransferase
MQFWLVISLVSLIFSVPVLLLSYYWLFLLASSVRYPKKLPSSNSILSNLPLVSILIASYNEKYVIGGTLDAIKYLHYPKSKLQVIVADDSTDETATIIDGKLEELNRHGISSLVSRRRSRENFKQGALNQAVNLVDGEYVLLLDADSAVTPDVLLKGIAALREHSDASFVSYRVGHYNRNQNLITRLYAISLDMGDMVTKMGAYRFNTPFSFQGGFTLVSTRDLRRVGLWSNERMADDADISIKLYLSGRRGIYLSDTRIMSEDPPTLETWKKQAARTSQGWSRCISKYWHDIISSPNISSLKKLAIFLMIVSPFSSLSWITVTFLSALSIIIGVVPPANSIFNNVFYIAAITVPTVLFFSSAIYALKLQKLLTIKNLSLIPILSYTSACTVVLCSMGFVYGILGRTGFFHYRTPKSGSSIGMTRTHYFRNLSYDWTILAEGILSFIGVFLAILVAEKGVWFLTFSLAGFGMLTLKSMNLTNFRRKNTVETRAPQPTFRVVYTASRALATAEILQRRPL